MTYRSTENGQCCFYCWLCVVQTVGKFKVHLEDDPIVRAHLDSLYDNLLEQNLCRIIEPFSKVQVEHVATLIKLPMVGGGGGVQGWILDHSGSGPQVYSEELY